MTVKVRLYAGLSGGLLLLTLVSGRSELVALAAPFAVGLIVGLGMVDRTVVSTSLRLARDRVLEDEPVDVDVHVRANREIAHLAIALDLPPPLRPAEGGCVQVVSVSASEPTVVRFQLCPRRWGAYKVGPVAFRTYDVAGFSVAEGVTDDRLMLRVHPRPETLTRLVAPAETQALVGNRLAPVRGDGIEFADLRPFMSGDRVREVNWRVAARGLGLWVNQRHPERNSDVVLFVDTFSEELMGRAVRAAATLVEAYGSERDRVGLVSFGGSLRWIQPGTGLAHLYRITEALIDTQYFHSYAWRGLRIVPAQTLPAKALVLALSPLEDERSIAALADLRRRGIDLAILELTRTTHHLPTRQQRDAPSTAHRRDGDKPQPSPGALDSGERLAGSGDGSQRQPGALGGVRLRGGSGSDNGQRRLDAPADGDDSGSRWRAGRGGERRRDGGGDGGRRWLGALGGVWRRGGSGGDGGRRWLGAVGGVWRRGGGGGDGGQVEGVGDRVWLLQREVRRVRFRRIGVPVVSWPEERSLAEVMEEVSAFRRRARRRVG